MKKKKAKKIMRSLLIISDELNSIDLLLERVEDEDDRKKLRRVVGEVGSTIYTDIMRPIIREYPDLDPDQ